MALPPLEGEVKITTNADATFKSIEAAALQLGSQLTSTQQVVKTVDSALQKMQSTSASPVKIQLDDSDFEEVLNEVEVSVEEAKKRMQEAFSVRPDYTTVHPGRTDIQEYQDRISAQAAADAERAQKFMEKYVPLTGEAKENWEKVAASYKEASQGGPALDFTKSQETMETLASSLEQAVATLRTGKEGVDAFQAAVSQIDPARIIELSQTNLTGMVPPRALESVNELQGFLGEIGSTLQTLAVEAPRGLKPFQTELQHVPPLLEEVERRVEHLTNTMRNLKGFRPEDITQDFGGIFRTADISAFAREVGSTPGPQAAKAVDDFLSSVKELSATMDVNKAISVTYRENLAQLEQVLGVEMPAGIQGTVKSLNELEKAFGRVKKAETIDPAKDRIAVEKARAARFQDTAQAIRDSGGEHAAFGLPAGQGVSRGGLQAAGRLIGQFVPGTQQLQVGMSNLTRLAPELTAALGGTALAVAGITAASLAAAAGIVGIVVAADRMEIANRQAEKLKETFGDSQKAIDGVQEAIEGRASQASIKPILLQVDAKSALAELDNFTKVSSIVQQRADELGTSWAEAMPKVVEAIKSGNYSQLEQLGLLDSSERAFALYAQELGTTTDKLTSVQKEQAILNRVITEFDPTELEDKTTTLGKSFSALAVSLKDAAAAGWEWFIAGTTMKANNVWEDIFGEGLTESAQSLIDSLSGMFGGMAADARESVAAAMAEATPLGQTIQATTKAQEELTAAKEEAAAAASNYVAVQNEYVLALQAGNNVSTTAAKFAFERAQADVKATAAALLHAEANLRHAEATQVLAEKIEAARTGVTSITTANQQGADSAKVFSDALADLAVSLDRVQQGANSSALSIASRLVPAMGVGGAIAQAEEWQGNIQQIRNSINQVNEEAGQIVIDEQWATMAINTYTSTMSTQANMMLETVRDTTEETIAQAKRIKTALDGALKGMAEGVTKPSTSGLLNWDIGSLKAKMDKEGTKFADAFGISFEDAMKKYGGNIDLITLFAGREDEVDEKARRLGTVLVSGFKSEYFDELRAEGLIPQDVIDQGEAAVRKFSAAMLREHEQGFVPALYDSAKVAEKVFDQIQTKAKRNEFMEGVIAQVKEMGASADELDIYDALGIDTSSERAAKKMTQDFGTSLQGILSQIQDQAKTGANAVSTMQTPADKMGEVTTAQTIKLKLAGTASATAFGEQMVNQTVQGKYGDRSVDQMLLEVDGRKTDVEKRGRIMGGWMGGALLAEFSDVVPVGLVNVLVTASAPAVYAKVIEMLNDR
jgi:hypothetical protein